MSQLDLFPRPDPPPRGSELAADVASDVRDLATRVPTSIRLGTSSWSFPGWAGLVYRRSASVARLARDGLATYARHPLLRTVGVDRTYYAPMRADELATYAADVPEDFRFVVKAHEHCTVARFPQHERYGSARGTTNPRCLDPAYACDVVAGPILAGLAHRAGVLLFQFPPQDVEALGGARFPERLHAMLTALPRQIRCAVELRNSELLTMEYAAALADTGAAHCLNVHPSMPRVDLQARLTDALEGPLLLVRWMLGRGLAYEQARERYRPFDRLVDEDITARQSIADLCHLASTAGRPAYVVINNKAEGSAPLSVRRLAERIVELRRT